MKRVILVILSCWIMVGCSSVTSEPPQQFEPKEVVQPLWGCKELRKEDPEADC